MAPLAQRCPTRKTMTTPKKPTTQPWIATLLEEIRALPQALTALHEQFGEETVDDISHLTDAASRLETMLNNTDQPANNHDLMNVLTAVRGYAEMLREDIGPKNHELDASLSSLLTAVQAAHSGNDGQDTADSRIIQSDPGFILAVDDLQENRELVARNLSRSGHFVITAASGEEALRALEQSDVDVVLLDPMFPTQGRAQVKKEMQVCRLLAGQPGSQDVLVHRAFVAARERVVVKRHPHEQPLAGAPSFSIDGERVRFDVYLKPKAAPSAP